MAKILDSVLNRYIRQHVKLHDAQFGFRPGLSTEAANKKFGIIPIGSHLFSHASLICQGLFTWYRIVYFGLKCITGVYLKNS